MKRNLLGIIAGGLLAAGLFVAPADAHAMPRDVFGRSVPVGAGRPALVLLSNEETRSILVRHAFALAFDLRELDPVVVVRVDLRGVPGLFKNMAKGEVKKAHRESVELMERYSRTHGVELPTELVDNSLYMVPDYDGAPHRSHKLQEGFRSIVAEVRDVSGAVVAEGRFPEDSARLARALEAAGDGRLTQR